MQQAAKTQPNSASALVTVRHRLDISLLILLMISWLIWVMLELVISWRIS
jgi:hypothetical protein